MAHARILELGSTDWDVVFYLLMLPFHLVEDTKSWLAAGTTVMALFYINTSAKNCKGPKRTKHFLPTLHRPAARTVGKGPRLCRKASKILSRRPLEARDPLKPNRKYYLGFCPFWPTIKNKNKKQKTIKQIFFPKGFTEIMPNALRLYRRPNQTELFTRILICAPNIGNSKDRHFRPKPSNCPKEARCLLATPW
jgi:hypothetical protein